MVQIGDYAVHLATVVGGGSPMMPVLVPCTEQVSIE